MIDSRMYVVADSLDDLLHKVFTKLLRRPDFVRPTKGDALEEFGNLLVLRNPLARLSRTETKGTIFSCLGEFLWYMRGSNRLDVIKHYLKEYGRFSDDGKTIYGAYGPRIFNKDGIDQLAYIMDRLTTSPTSRKAVLQLFDARDVTEEHKDVPCTCTLQFAVRKRRLSLHVNMRSNDAYIGLPHDIFSFTLLQEFIARCLGLRLGPYYHSVGSLHLYTTDREDALRYLREGFQDPQPMPPMPTDSPGLHLLSLLDAEEHIRSTGCIPAHVDSLPPYWRDLVRLLQIFKEADLRVLAKLKDEMSSKVFETYIRRRHKKRDAKQELPLFEWSGEKLYVQDAQQ